MTPALTVLMSVHNGLPFLKQAVLSVLDQSHPDFEFLIIDDASTDGSREWLRSQADSRIRVVTLDRNVGLTSALNLGLHEARGYWIARHDADDFSQPDRFARQLDYLSTHKKCVVVGSQADLIDAHSRSQGRKKLPCESDSIRFAHLFDNAIIHSAAMFRKDAILDSGGYNSDWVVSQDYELWSRLSQDHQLANLPQSLIHVRLLPGGITMQHKRPDLIRQVQRTHYQRLFGKAPSDADLDLIALFRTRVVPERLPEFRAMFDEMTAEFRRTHPRTSKSPDFHRTLSLLHERVGYNLLTLSRFSALGEIRRAIQAWPPALLSLPWFRICALATFGDGIRRLYERWTSRAARRR